MKVNLEYIWWLKKTQSVADCPSVHFRQKNQCELVLKPLYQGWGSVRYIFFQSHDVYIAAKQKSKLNCTVQFEETLKLMTLKEP